MARDAWRKPSDIEYKYDPNTPTSNKDQYYKGVYTQIEELASQSRYAGSNFWAYGGLGRPDAKPNAFNMTWLGGKDKSQCTLHHSTNPIFYVLDPPHEPKGWYSVYDKDNTTIAIIKEHYKHLLNKK